jgi:hypothetical protein
MADEYDDINETLYDEGTLIALLRKDIKYIRKNVCDIKAALEKNYVTKVEFTPVKRIVYGLVSLVMTTVIASLLFLSMGGMAVLK